MRHLSNQLGKTLSKIAVFLALGVLTVGLSVFAVDRLLKDQGGLGSISSSIEAIRLRSMYPTMKPEVIAREAAKANKGPLGLAATLSKGQLDQATASNAAMADAFDGDELDVKNEIKKQNEKDVYVRVAENREAMLKAQFSGSPDESTSKVRGAIEELGPNSKAIPVARTTDGREVVGVVGENVGEFGAVDRIKAMNIPDHMKNQIIKNYYATGSLPEILVKEKMHKEKKN